MLHPLNVSLQAVALVAALEVVVRKILVKVSSDLLRCLVPFLPTLGAEAFVEQDRLALRLFFEPQQPITPMREIAP